MKRQTERPTDTETERDRGWEKTRSGYRERKRTP